MRSAIEIGLLIAMALVLAIALSIGLKKEIHRQDVACHMMEKNGYEVECR